MKKIVLEKGFTLIPCREEEKKLDQLESSLDIFLPPIFKLFSEKFDITKIKWGDPILYKGETYGISKLVYGVENYSFENDDILLEEFIDVEDVLNNASGYDYWHVQKRLYIAMTAGDGGILLGVKDSEKDIVYAKNLGGEIVEVGKDIFDFFSKVGLVINQEFLDDYGIEVNDVYKKFGEDFWRIKNESSSV